jgi:hypothetical protein
MDSTTPTPPPSDSAPTPTTGGGSPPSSASSSPSPVRTVRTYKERSAADQAVAVLKAEGIHAVILDLALTPGSRNVKPGAVRLVVDAEAADKATSLLLKHDRENKPAAAEDAADRVRRRRYQPLPPGMAMPRGLFGGLLGSLMRGQSSGAAGRRGLGPGALLFFVMAITAAAMGVYFWARSQAGPRNAAAKASKNPERLVYEDLNGDGKIDFTRFVTGAGLPMRQEQDFNFDGKWDIRLSYENGRLVKRAADTDGNGIYDEETYYDSLGRPYYSQLIPNGRGPAVRRTFFREAIEFDDYVEPEDAPVEDPSAKVPSHPVGGECRAWKILLDNDADGQFDIEREVNLKGETLKERNLPKGAPENDPPTFISK